MSVHNRVDRAVWRVAVPVALVAAAALIARAYDTTWITQNQPLSSTKLKADLDEIQARVMALETISNAVPPGTIAAYGGAMPPMGWVLCDGKQYNGLSPTYAALYQAIGVGFGGDLNAQAFNVPDLRGRFLRGTDNGAGHDPDAAKRTASTAGGNTGDAVGGIELDDFAGHTHGVNDPGHSHPPVANAGQFSYANAFNLGLCDSVAKNGVVTYCYANATGPASTGISLQVTGGKESRPLNVGVNYIIKL